MAIKSCLLLPQHMSLIEIIASAGPSTLQSVEYFHWLPGFVFKHLWNEINMWFSTVITACLQYNQILDAFLIRWNWSGKVRKMGHQGAVHCKNDQNKQKV